MIEKARVMFSNLYSKYFKSLSRNIVIMLILDLLFLLIMEVCLRKIPAPFPIFVKIGDLCVTLGISFIASFIFYIVQVHLPRIKEKEDLFPYIASMFYSILTTEKEILTKLLGLKIEELSEESITEKASGLDLYTEAPLYIGGLDSNKMANWIEYCIFQVNNLDRTWNMMMNYSTYLDSECMALLYRMHSTECFLETVRRLFQMFYGSRHRLPFKRPKELIGFWNFINEQQEYYDRVLAKYSNK